MIKAKKNQNYELSEWVKVLLNLISVDICSQFPMLEHWDKKSFLKAINNYT